MRTQLSIAAILFGFSISAHAAVDGYSDHSLWAAAASPTALETFDGLSTGAISSIASVGVTSMSGINYLGSSTGQFVTSQFALPFPMFSAGALPSSPNFISNDMSSPGFATGSLTFFFGSPLTAVGAFVADSAPIDGFSIELFDGAFASLGSIHVGSRTLSDSFVGIVSTTAFSSAKFSADSISDSWGLDNLEVSAVPEPETYAMLLAGLGLLGFMARRRKESAV